MKRRVGMVRLRRFWDRERERVLEVMYLVGE